MRKAIYYNRNMINIRLKNKTNKMMVKLPLCPGTKCRNTKGAEGRFFVINIQPSTCPKQEAGRQDI